MTHPTLPPIPERVARGAALLDRAWPGWAAQVDPDRLTMADGDSGVLGQLYGHLNRGLAALGDPDAVAHGFDLDADADDDADDPALAACWRAEVTRRRPGQHPPTGPAEQAPAGPFLTEPQRRALLAQALAGVELGAHDQRVLDWLAGWEPATVRTIASLLSRARAAGRREGAR